MRTTIIMDEPTEAHGGIIEIIIENIIAARFGAIDVIEHAVILCKDLVANLN